MKLRKSTRYALFAALELARAGPDEAVTATRVAELYELPGSVLAKVFQQLVRAGIVVGTRGQYGGYRLARESAGVTMLDVMDAIDPPGETRGRPGAPRAEPTVRARNLYRVFAEVEELERCTFASISLETLAASPRIRPGSSPGPRSVDTPR